MNQLRAAYRRLRGARRRKREGELSFWHARKAEEGTLRNEHYERYFTGPFELETSFFDGKRMLDIGCGPRGSLEWAVNAARRVGLDPLVDDYRGLGIGAHAMEYVCAPAERMPFADGSFDVVSSLNSLDHVDDVRRVAAEIKRALAPGGTFLLITEVGHEPRWEEPQDFGWEVLELFGPELEVVLERRYEHGQHVYESVARAEPFDTENATPRAGILLARLTANG